MPHLIIDDAIPYIRSVAERLGECTYLPGREIRREHVRHADALIVRTRTKVDGALLAGSRVGFVATATIGFDHLDTAWLEAHGIGWTNCPGCNASSVAQYVAASVAATRPTAAPATLGIIGLGHVGTAVAQRFRAEGWRILAYDPYKADATATLGEVLTQSDVITLHTPLTHSGDHPTYHMASDDFFARIAEGGRRPIFVNAARGACMDTPAVEAAIAAGIVSAAVIDTWEDEPHIAPSLLQAAAIATPHIAGYSANGKAVATRMTLAAVARHLGVPLDVSHIAPPPMPMGYRYDPLSDDAALRRDPAAFETLRAHYPLRWEETPLTL